MGRGQTLTYGGVRVGGTVAVGNGGTDHVAHRTAHRPKYLLSLLYHGCQGFGL